MISYWNVLILCISCFMMATEIASHAFKPELHFSWWNIAGWVFFILSILSWEYGRK